MLDFLINDYMLSNVFVYCSIAICWIHESYSVFLSICLLVYHLPLLSQPNAPFSPCPDFFPRLLWIGQSGWMMKKTGGKVLKRWLWCPAFNRWRPTSNKLWPEYNRWCHFVKLMMPITTQTTPAFHNGSCPARIKQRIIVLYWYWSHRSSCLSWNVTVGIRWRDTDTVCFISFWFLISKSHDSHVALENTKHVTIV